MFTESMRIEEWKFRSDRISPQRLYSLGHDLSFSMIVQRIANEMIDIEFCSKVGDKEAKNKKRAEFFFSVGKETLDIFFNGPQGYRAQYYLNPLRGIKCNRFVIDILKGKLLEAAGQTNQDIMTLEQVKKSIEYESAKAWIDEDHSTLNQTSRDPDEILILEVPRWVEAMYQVLTAWNAGQQPTPTIKSRALLGVQAPEGSLMKVLGAWLDNNDCEFVVPSKIDRALHIHNYGFS